MVLRPSRSATVLAQHVRNEVAKQSTGGRFFGGLLTLVVLAGVGYLALHSTPHSQLTPMHTEDGPVSTAAIDQDSIFSRTDIPITLWSSDFHISPIADIKYLLQSVPNVTVIDKSLSGHCHLTDTCAQDLRVINRNNGIELSPCPNRIRREFYDSYKNDPVMQTVDAFVCAHAASMCELFMPFQKPMIVIASTRYEIGRLDGASWRRWNHNLQLIASNPHNTIAANNRYDQEYIRYFTGIDNVVLLPNLCGYVRARHAPTRTEVLLGPARGVHHTIQQQLFEALRMHAMHGGGSGQGSGKESGGLRGSAGNRNSSAVPKIVPIRELYPHFEYADLAAHPAIVLLPYQVSLMSIVEYYRMNIPLFVPAPQLLARWHVSHQVLNERSWMAVNGAPQQHSILRRHPRWDKSTVGNDRRADGRSGAPEAGGNNPQIYSSTSPSPLPPPPLSDPNDEFTQSAVLEWIALSDFYQWPHIGTFDSWSSLLRDLRDPALLRQMSQGMAEHNRREEARIRRDWAHILEKVRAHKEDKRPSSGGDGVVGSGSSLPASIDDSLQQTYGYTLSPTDCKAQIYSRDSRLST